MRNKKLFLQAVTLLSYYSRIFTQLSWILLIGLVTLSSLNAAAEQDPTASQVIEDLQSQLLHVMKQADDLGYQGRYERLALTVNGSHNLPMLARVSVGRNWKQLDEQQKQNLIDTFSRLSIATYAHQFDGYSGEVFEIVSEEDASRGDKIVRTLLIKQDGEEVHLDYILRRNKNDWLIINVIADGVSDLALKRSEYSAILRREGFDTLIDKLNAKIESYSHHK